MNKQDLLQLEKLATLTPKEIKKQQPALFSKLSERASLSLKDSVKAKLVNVPQEVRETLDRIDFSPVKLGKLDVKAVLTEKLLDGLIPAEKKKELEEVSEKLPRLGTLDDIIQPELPVFVNPAFRDELMKAKVYHLSDLAGLPAEKAEKALAKEVSLNSISSEKLDELVKERVISRKEANALGLTSNLYTLLDSSFELTEQVKESFPIQTLEELVKVDRAAWLKVIRESKVTLPEELKQEEYAELLFKKVESLFPEAALAYRITQVKAMEVSKGLEELKPLLEKNEKVFGVSRFAALDTDGLSDAEIQKLSPQFEHINSLVNLHPGLQLEEVLHDKNLGVADKGQRMAERIGLYYTFVQNNADINFLRLEYRHDSEDVQMLNFQGLKPAEQSMVLKSVKAQQRIYSFTHDVEHTAAIMASGYHSSYHVTAVTLPEFIQTTKLEPGVASRYYENAHMALIRTTGMLGSVLDVIGGSFDWTAVGNTSPGVKDYLKDIPGYQDLFGDMAFCDCSHCQSIYSPAAYFVDLMQFVERHVLSKHFTGSKAGHVLNLKVRRPDLWSLPLTCENTTTIVPYLDIINEILESYIASKKGFAGNLNDRAAVETFIYKREIALEKPGNWKNSLHSFNQPFHLPLASLAAYLGHFEKSREDIAILLDKPQSEISKARFNLSGKEYQLITTPDASPAFLQRIFGISFTVTAGKITPFNAQLLLKALGVDRKELETILKSKYVTDNGADAIAIQGEKTNVDSIQNDIERVRNLTYQALDRLHRFVRLWRKTAWSPKELDLVLTLMRESAVANDMNADAITSLGLLARLQESLKLEMEELLAIAYRLPTERIQANQPPIFDRLFNHEDVVTLEGAYPKNTTTFIHPSLAIDQSTTPAEFSSARLIAALNRADDEILALLQHLAQPLGIVGLTSATESERGFKLTLANLSLLYRHSKIAEAITLSVPDLFRMIKLLPEFANGYIENVSHLQKLLAFHQWWKSTPYSLDDLYVILETGEVQHPENYERATEVVERVLSQVQSSQSLRFAKTIFSAYFPDVNELQSEEILQANASLVEAAPEGTYFRLKTDFDPATPITVPAGISRAEPVLRNLLVKYHPQYLIPHYLSGLFSMSEESLASIIAALGIDLDADVYTIELQGSTTPAAALVALVEKLLPLRILFNDRKFTTATMALVLSKLPSFGIGSLDNITIDNIRKLRSFLQFIQLQEDGSSNISEVGAVLSAFDAATQFQTANQEQLARVLQTKAELLASLHPLGAGLTDALGTLAAYHRLAELCSYIGISGTSLPKIVSSQYDELNEATQALLAAFRSKYKREEERKAKLENYQDLLRTNKRASLTNYLIYSGFPQFEQENDLFHYFLIDTELEGCARTSRLVAATMSVQLYLHRVLLNLEQDDQEPGTANRVRVQAADIPADEWQWRKNYRVWEANRKVFLYPENYIEPELRDDKTPLFEELEKELLQQEINADTVLDAYGKYMRGFDEVAHLKIAGSYHERDTATQTDVLHLFGVTADEPPMYYYRRVENVYYSEKRDDRGLVWNPWQKINVQIPVRKVAPITYNGRLHVFWVRVTTLANTVFDNNRSVFVGYSHKYSIEFTTLKLDGSWTSPQKLTVKDCYPFERNGVILDPLVDEYEIGELRNQLPAILRNPPFFQMVSAFHAPLRTPRYDTAVHWEPRDEYTLDGFLWDQVYPYVDSSGRLILSGTAYQMRAAVDFYNLGLQNAGVQIKNVTSFPDPAMESVTVVKNKPSKILDKSGNSLYRATTPQVQYFDNYAYSSLLINSTKSNTLLQRLWHSDILNASFDGVRHEQIASLRSGSTVQVVNGSFGDAIIDVNGDLLFLKGSVVDGNGYLLRRMGTTLSETLTRTLFTSGVDTTLSIATQKALKEAAAPISITANRIQNGVVSNKIDFKGAYGNYYREIFFHIPFLIANHLNSQGKYAEAQKWYHYIFNPSATEVINFPAGLTAAQKRKLELDRNWQYLEFREIDVQKLRDQLNDKQAIEVYKKDPFNPHAIARLRLSAYQKSIVMKYIDNLLDWGDQLFTQFTMESVNEATLLYIIAKEILGERPAQIGACGEGKVNPKTYENIQPLLDKGSEFLAELENYTIVKTDSRKISIRDRRILENNYIKENSKLAYRKYASNGNARYLATEYGVSDKEFNQLRDLREQHMPELSIKPVNDAVSGAFAKGTIRALDWKKESIYVQDTFKLPSFGGSLIKHVSPVFCVPGNKDLLDYYTRVEDRLSKIRSCRDIQGQRRQLALFAPEIDPRLLVRARAAGLSLDDVLNSISGNLPPYRFSYILERAKAFTAVVQGFGAALLSAIEKKNGEELALLRLTQQQNILEMTSRSRRLEIDSANESIKVLNDRIESLSYQLGHYESLIAEHLIPSERIQQISRHLASAVQVAPMVLDIWAGISKLIPQVGSPFAMKWGGLELGHSAESWASVAKDVVKAAEAVATSAGLEAGFERRSEGWKHQKKLLQYELKQAEKNLRIAEIRRDILLEADRIHQKNIEHLQDVMDFYGEKFSSLGLYTWLSSTMQRLFKEAYTNALSIARLAEQAYRYERDDTTIFIDGSYFESSRAGLLAGERLLMALQSMERRYLENNYRKNEMDQAFSLTQINPAALLLLKQSGSCTFSIPELFFDLFYPGQYKRKIQSVRLSIPSVTGPYTNVSATLSLTGSQIRMEPKLGAAELKDVPNSRTTLIATSTAQNDSGVFQLNFRDERYMPFEGAGAISSWKLSLPKNFRQFDYQTINDVIIHISYTAEYDELFRDKVEAQNDAMEGTLLNILKNNSLYRLLSLRQEFSTDFHRLSEQPVDSPVVMKIQNKHFPLFMNGRNLKVKKAKLVLVTLPTQTVGGVRISVNASAQTGFTRDAALGGLFTKDLGNLFNAGIIKDHTLSIIAGGDLAPAAPAAGPAAALDAEKIEDILIYIEYGLG